MHLDDLPNAPQVLLSLAVWHGNLNQCKHQGLLRVTGQMSLCSTNLECTSVLLTLKSLKRSINSTACMVKQGGCESLVWDSLVTKFWFCFEAPAEQHGWHDEFAAFQASHPGQLEMSQKEKEAFEMAFEQAKQGKWIRVRQKKSISNE